MGRRASGQMMDVRDNTYLVRKDEIAELPEQRKAHFLNENARCTSRSPGDATGLTGLGFHIIDVQPGHASTEFHFHYNEDECVYVLSGQGTAQIGDDVFEISAGDFMGYPKGGPAHTMTNTGTEVLRCIVVGERASSDVVDYPHSGKRIFRTTGLPWKVVDLDDVSDRPVVK
jgi:uncharacterized cupin superfamily protein